MEQLIHTKFYILAGILIVIVITENNFYWLTGSGTTYVYKIGIQGILVRFTLNLLYLKFI